MHKRFEMRRSIGFPIEIISPAWDDPIQLVAGDLSPRGAYLCTDILPEMGEQIVCSFTLPREHRELSFFGEVTRVNLLRRRCDLGWPGFGVRFLDAKPFDRIRIREALRGLPPPVPGIFREPIIDLVTLAGTRAA